MSPERPAAPHRIVAIGASAGGLEPLEQLFAALPADTGCSFVVVQHLSPDFRSMMGELLARHTRMPIERMSDGMTLEPDRVYLNLPRVTATLADGVLKLEDMADLGDLYRPIDRFLGSLALERGDQALAIILSGTASDGTEGAARIKEHGGQVIAQSLETARFDSMPRAVMDADLDDAIGDPATIAALVERWAAGEKLAAAPLVRIADDPIGSILALVRREYDTDFEHYKPATVSRRINRRAELRHCKDLDAYYDLLVADAEELDELYGDILIEVTAFFRDREAFAEIESQVIPSLVEKLEAGDQLRIWIAGCASGEEAYSLAMLLIENAERAGTTVDAKILATDVHGRSLERANAGEYPRDSVAHMPAERVMRFFDVHEDSVQVKSEVRRLLLFSTHDVLRDTPFTQIDLLSCRNLLIYFNDDAQERVLTKFHFALQKSGFLVLGPSESTAGLTDEFEVLDARWRLYRKKRNVSLHGRLDLVPLRSNASKQRVASRMTPRPYNPAPRPMLPDERTLRFRRAHNLALEQIVTEYAPPGFLLSGNGDIVHIFGDAGRLLPLQQGAFSRRITDLIRTDFRAVLFAALQKANDPAFERLERRLYVREGGEDTVPYDIVLAPVETSDDDNGFLLLTIRQLENGIIDEHGVLVSGEGVALAGGASGQPRDGDWIDDGSSAVLSRRISVLEHSLRTSEESLQTTIEELETSNEELQSTNEELTASNEELQSTNEELHSVNEELYTVSSEHQRKIVELSELTEDINLLLDASEIGTIHFDRMLRVKRASPMACELLQLGALHPGKHVDGIESPIGQLGLATLVRRVSETGQSEEQQFDADEQRHQMVRVRASLDTEGQINGVLVSCFDLSEVVEAQNELIRVNADFRSIVEDTASFIVRWNAADDRISFCNATYAAFFDSTPDKMIGKSLRELIPDSEREEFFATVEAIEPNETRHLSVLRELPDNRITYTVGFTRAIADDIGQVSEYQSTGQDLSDEFRYRRALEALVGIGNEKRGDHASLLTRILTIGLTYFELDSAFLAGLTDSEYRVLAVAGDAAESVTHGDVLPRSQTVCDMLLDDRSVLSFTQLSQSASRDHASWQSTGVESYIGVRLRSFDGMQGAISFSSPLPRRSPFSVADESFLLLIGNWLSTLLDERRRLVVIADENRYYQSLYLNVPVMMFLADDEGQVIEVSDRLLELLGRPRPDVVDKPAVSLFMPVDASLAAGALSDGNCRDLAVTLDLGEGRTLECEMSCQRRDVGSLRRIRMCVLTDVSARNQALEATEEHNRRLATANENLNQFAFVASHDLQEPLRKIQQFSSFLQEDYADRVDDDGRYHLKVIVDAAERMSTLIKDLLEYSRTSRNGIEPRQLSLRSVMDEVLDDLELPVREARATVDIGELPSVSADPVLVRQLFTNLIGNALKYRDDDRALKLSIGPGTSSSGTVDERVIELTDSGIGFDPDYAARIFEPFTRLNTVQEYAGSGIGLAICATVCEKHGWTLSADSRPGRGSTFRIRLPGERPRDEVLNGTGGTQADD